MLNLRINRHEAEAADRLKQLDRLQKEVGASHTHDGFDTNSLQHLRNLKKELLAEQAKIDLIIRDINQTLNLFER